ncbi:membrane protein containing Mechanosensitive ion channel MscS [Candidatus Magnetomorum sp. HK-1]|nr:membrane protein containing Mechanosensitive ion channel MscS [Candidatus Magnetomorum sp. HK-1]
MKKFKQNFFLICLGVFAISLVFFQIRHDEINTIYIAMVGPLSGADHATGKSFLKGINLYLDKINRQGGINGKRVLLDIYDDENNPIKAEQKAREIVKINRNVAVIGHHYSSCSINAGKIYKKYHIPAITPTSTNVNVTLKNPWYFRTVVSDKLQTRFLAMYAKNIFPNRTRVSIIHENMEYGKYLARVFKQSAKKMRIRIKYQWKFDNQQKNLDERLENIVRQLKKKKNAGLVFLATHATEGAKLLKLIKKYHIENPILAPDSFTSKSFRHSLSCLPKEKENPGYYTNGMYVTTPMIIDMLNEKGQLFKHEFENTFHEEPDWHAAFAYDTIALIVQAMKKKSFSGDYNDLKQDRIHIRNSLSSLNTIHNAMEGVTGYVYFDKQGDSQKSIFTGIYKNRQIVSTFTQFQVVPNIYEVPNYQKEIKKKHIIPFDKQYMFKINTVYTGIEIKKIYDIDMRNMTYGLDFYLWFRYKGKINPEKLTFLNAAEKVIIGEPIDQEHTKDITYEAYHIRGRFKADFIPGAYAYKERLVGVSFCHKDLTRNNLIYVADVLGMRLDSRSKMVDKLKKAKVLTPTSGYTINDFWVFQNIAEKASLGAPRYLKIQEGKIKFSQFNIGIRIRKNELSLRNMIRYEFVDNLLISNLVIFVFISIFYRGERLRRRCRIIWFFQMMTAITALISCESLAVERLMYMVEPYQAKIIKYTFDILWWIVPAFFVDLAIKRFIWIPIEDKTEREIPDIVIGFFTFVIFTLALCGVSAYVFEQKITSILAASGVFAMIIGLAIQINISNIFSGIALNIERPFLIGDWVKIANIDEGRVVDITWRATRLQTRDNSIISVPNSMASESIIRNFHYPTRVFRYWFQVNIDPTQQPENVEKILLDAVLSSQYILAKPPPAVSFSGLTQWSAEYTISYSTKNFANKVMTRNNVWNRVWNHLKRAGISPVFQRQDIPQFRDHAFSKSNPGDPIECLNDIEIFYTLSDEAKRKLSRKMKQKIYQPEDVIIKQDDPGDAVFIIIEGAVCVRIKLPDETEVEVGRLGAGDFFGELALLTGEPRKASIIAQSYTRVFEIPENTFIPMMQDELEVARRFKEKIYHQPRMQVPEEVTVQKKEKKGIYSNMISGLKNILGNAEDGGDE